jgi:aarF domain-containing kinase
MAELDFEREAATLTAVADSLAALPEIAVPRPVPGMVSPTCLVMTWLPGQTLLHGIESLVAQTAEQLGVSPDDIKTTLRQQMTGGPTSAGAAAAETTADTTASTGGGATGGASAVRSDGASGAAHVLTFTSWTAKLRLGWALLRARRSALAHRVRRYLRLLVVATGHQLLVSGVYTSDPHPGNVLMMPDGRLGLLDFGQSASLTPQQRLWLARVLVAVVENDADALAALATERGTRTAHNRRDTLAFLLAAPLDSRPVHLVAADAARHQELDPLLALGDGALTLPFRPLVLVQAVCRLLGWHVSIAHELEPLARRVLAEHGHAHARSKRRPEWAHAGWCAALVVLVLCAAVALLLQQQRSLRT